MPTKRVEWLKTLKWMRDGEDLFIMADGIKIAKRGRTGTPAGSWVSLEPGWQVIDGKDSKAFVIAHDGVGREFRLGSRFVIPKRPPLSVGPGSQTP